MSFKIPAFEICFMEERYNQEIIIKEITRFLQKTKVDYHTKKNPPLLCITSC
jgi:hypothetical protein